MNRGLIFLLSLAVMVSCNPKQQATDNSVAGSPITIAVVNNGNVKLKAISKIKLCVWIIFIPVRLQRNILL